MTKTPLQESRLHTLEKASTESSTNRVVSQAGSQPSARESFREAKLKQRRYRWRWNQGLLISSLASVFVLLAAGIGSYFYHSSATAVTFQELASVAEEKGDFSEQAKWLRRYSLLVPDDLDAVYQTALAADHAADASEYGDLGRHINEARKSLSGAIARVGVKDEVMARDLRLRLISRLLQLGGPWNREAERQIQELGAPDRDPQAVAFLAMALANQIGDGTYAMRDAKAVSKEGNYWGWMANQPVAYVLGVALQENPGDLSLINHFLFTRLANADQFQGDVEEGEMLSQQEFAAIETACIVSLEESRSSRAKIVLYQYLQSEGKRGLAIGVLKGAAEAARTRLSASDANSLVKGEPADSVDQQKWFPTSIERPLSYWDFIVVHELARVSQVEEPEEAVEHYRFLTALDLKSDVSGQIENLYLDSGRLLFDLGRPDEALGVWQAGLDRVGKNSILLPRAIAGTYLTQGRLDEARETASIWDDAIESASIRLARVSEAEMVRAERIAWGRRLDAARWSLGVVNGYVAAASGDELRAIGLLETAVNSDAPVSTPERVEANIRLAGFYGHQGMWDASGAAFERAVVLDPGNQQLRIAASNAWNQSGNRLKAMRQWDFIDSGTSLANQIARLEARFNYQVRLLPDQRNFDDIRADVRQLKKQLEIAVEAEGGISSPDVKQGERTLLASSGDDQNQEGAVAARSLQSSLRFIEALELTVPEKGVSSEEHLVSVDLAERIDDLAKHHPGEPQLQSFAAERLAQSGQEQAAMAALERLAKLEGADGVYEPMVRARVLSALGRHIEAANCLIEVADKGEAASVEGEAVPPLRGVSSRTFLLQTAAGFAIRGSDSELAYRALSSITNQEQTLATLTMIAGLAKRLPADSTALAVNGKSVSRSELFQHWLQVLHNREGDDGTHWRFLRAVDLLGKLQAESRVVDFNHPQLSEIRDLISEILARRPRWGDAIALEGWAWALEGNPEKAVARLRRGIAAGSTQMQIRRLLWEQLILLGRNAEAEQEIRIAEMGSVSQPGEFSTTRIEIAMKQGDYAKSMDVALEFAASKPGDALAQLVVAATGTTALQSTKDPSERERFLGQARDAVQRAAELTDANDPRIFAAKLRLASVLADQDSISELVHSIETSDVAEPHQSQLLAQAYFELEEFEKTLEMSLRVEKVAPSSASQLQLAEIYRVLKREEDEVNSLRIALERDSSNRILRNRLAQTLVARSSAGKPVDWQEIGRLLSEADDVGASNRLLHAILLASDGLRVLKEDTEKEDGSRAMRSAALQKLGEAEEILRQLIKRQVREVDTAKRFLATVLREEANYRSDASAAELARFDSEIRSLYEGLVNQAEPLAIDMYHFANYLLAQSEPSDEAKLDSLLSKMTSIAGDKLETLEVALRITERKGNRSEIPSLVGDWAENALASQSGGGGKIGGDQADSRSLMVFAAAGTSLQKLGFAEDSLQWFERAYQARPEALGPYVVALGRNGKKEAAVEVCAAHFDKHRDAQSAMLIAEVLLSVENAQTQADLIQVHQKRLDDAVEQFGDEVTLLEGVGTLQMTQGDFEAAVKTFSHALKVNPASIRALNNLAMAYSEIPQQASEGLAPIETALKLTNQNPELLDTKGVVLLASNRVGEAEAVFEEAFAVSGEPRHLFHVIVAQLSQGKKDRAQKAWKRLDLEKLDPTALTPSERERLNEMKRQFSGRL
ncbi:hypothetical protein [Rhodopirellula sp. SWK7]|uniref:hypothetical protein n=1 Tax=Rhodopirellula sp. SWK7 TaxID=595460 RepID=UPI0002BF1280|nr:hypothetical protein [Rhodopirellula sp. SWK7]EMI44602.1 hypothetical protein RRSWK_02668 [Rhodopirellula sp. SWK7]